jgi:hypothetical protein
MYDKTANSGFLNVGFTGAEALVAQELVEIVDDFEVAKPTADASIEVLGLVVVPCDASGDPVTIETRHTKLRTLTTGAAVTVGAFVLDSNNAVINYNNALHDSAAIQGHILEADATGGSDVACLLF